MHKYFKEINVFKKIALRITIPKDIHDQLERMKKMKCIQWKDIPVSTQKYLVELLAKKAGVTVYELIQDHYRKIKLEELDKTLRCLYIYYRKHPEREGQDVCSYILSQLGFGPYEELDERVKKEIEERKKREFEKIAIEEQLERMKKMKCIQWKDIPVSTQKYLVELLAKKAGVTVYELTQDHYGKIKLEKLNKTLIGLYKYYQGHPEREGQDVCSYILSQLGYGLPPFNAAGRLYASSRAEYLSQSLYHLLNMMREIIKELGFDSDRLSVLSGKFLHNLLRGNLKYKGLVSALIGYNIFNLSSIELLCLALQHVPLDELGIEGTPNYLRPELFSHGKKIKQTASSTAAGSYGVPLRTLEELQWLLEVLERKIRQLGTNGETEEAFSPKWMKTQEKLLGALPRRLGKKEKGVAPVSAPLACALGKYDYGYQSIPTRNDNVKLNPKLDKSQETAAKLILNDQNPLVVVHGPAGAGKTTMLHEAVRRLVLSGKRVLYVTPTHKAADVFMDRVARSKRYRNIPMLRLASRDGKLSTRAKDYWERDDGARRNFRDKKEEVKGSLYVGTMAAGVHYITEGHADFSDYDVVIIDEASMASKPEVYTALNYAKRAVLVGDHVQLEPFPVDRDIVKELRLNEGQRERVEKSLLEELMFAGYPHILLGTNYRAINPVMILLASRVFYDERIRINHDSPYFTLPKEDRAVRYPQDSLKLTDTSKLPFRDKKEEREGTSYYNEKEAELVVEQVREYLSQGFRLEDVAIITPYMAQVRLIKDKIRRAFPDVAESYLDKWISTFDGFQGDENKCVIISFVRSNKEHPPETGFVGNYHRVNVGLTRAKERMAIIGDLETLKKTGNGHVQQKDLKDNLSQQTRHIFEELERLILELEEEKRARVIRIAPRTSHHNMIK